MIYILEKGCDDPKETKLTQLQQLIDSEARSMKLKTKVNSQLK